MRVHGVEETDDEKVREKVIQAIKEEIDVNINPDKIDMST